MHLQKLLLGGNIYRDTLYQLTQRLYRPYLTPPVVLMGGNSGSKKKSEPVKEKPIPQTNGSNGHSNVISTNFQNVQKF